MKEKKNILMICSWLNVEKNIGLFFWEQAEIMNPNFNTILCHFNKKNIKLKKIKKIFEKTHIKENLTPNNIRTFEIEYKYFVFLPKKINSYILKKTILNFEKKLKNLSFDIDLIHCQSIFDAGIIGYEVSKIVNKPVIFTEHNQFNLRNKTIKEVKTVDKLLTHSSKKLVVSYDKIRQFAANFLFADFEVVGNSINENIFNYETTSIKNDFFTITTIGAFDPIKDQDTILKSLKLVDEELSTKIIFNWIGYNAWGIDNENKVNELIEKYNYKNIIVNLKATSTRLEIVSILKKSDLFLFSSISEGMPVSVLEALACGLPVCTTRCGGVDEIINEENGAIIQIKDYINMSKFILNILKNEKVFNSEKISKDILQQFGTKSFYNKMNKLYNEVISEN